MATTELNGRGWHLKEDSVDALSDGGKCSIDALIKKFIDLDLRETGAPWFNEDINRSKLDYVQGPAVLQLQKLRVVSAPKDNEHSQAAPKLCRLSLTDGHVTCSGITLEPIHGIGTNTAPGTKVLLSGTIEVETCFLLLNNKNFRSLGGRVENLAESWELKKTLAQQSLTRARGEGGPPPFVPFGKKISKELPSLPKDNFKSLAGPKEKKPAEDSEFEQQRQAEIQQALQAKSSSGGVKTFGGGIKTQINDKDVARITEMGFSAEDATSALRTSGGNVNEAINQLLSGAHRYQRGDRGGGRGVGRGGGGGDGGGRRGRRDRDREDDEGDTPVNTRPSGPATLFDFLETKIPTKEDAKKSSSMNTNNTSQMSYHQSSTPQDKLYGDSRKINSSNQNSGYQQRNQQPQQQRCAYRDGISRNENQNPRVGNSGFRNNQENINSGRGRGNQQQDLPPRFARAEQDQRGSGGGQRDRNGTGRQGQFGKGEIQEDRNNARGSARSDIRDGNRDQGREEGRDQGTRKNNYNQRYNRENFERYSGREDMSGSPDMPGAYPRKPPAFSQNLPQHGGNENFPDPRGRKGQSNYGPRSGYTDSSTPQWQSHHSNRGGPRGYQHNERSQREDPHYGSRHQGPPPQPHQDSSQNYNTNRSGRPYGGRGGGYYYNDDRGGYPGKSNNRGQMNFDNNYNQHQQERHMYQDESFHHQKVSFNGEPPFSSIGDTVLAKYWEDEKYYPAVVERVSPVGNTVVVTFVEYGNQEEVAVSDLLPFQQQGWNLPLSPPMYDVPNFDMGGYSPSPAYVPPMEFTPSGGQGRRRQDNDRQRPTQRFYVAPNQRGGNVTY